MKLSKFFSVLKSYSIITFGLLCYAAAWSIFLIPNHLVGGGVTGISAIIQYCTGFELSYSYFIINVVLIAIALKVLGGGFGVKTIYAMIVTSLALKFLPMLIPQAFIQEIAVNNGKLLCAIIGAGISGFGIALTFSQGGSSGGTDIIALIINKYRAISPGRVIWTLDLIIIACSMIVPTDGSWGTRVATVIYGYIIAGVFSFSLDLAISGSKQCVQMMVFSSKYEEIADRINNDIHRGVTVLDGMGWYSKKPVKVLLIVARKYESKLLFNVIQDVDPHAFISEGTVRGVFGQGFEQIKTK